MVDIKKLLESSSVDSVVKRLKENPYKNFNTLFESLKNDNVFTSCYEAKLYMSSNKEQSLTESVQEIKSILKENSIEVVEFSKIEDEGLCFTQEVVLVKKDVERFCNGKLD